MTGGTKVVGLNELKPGNYIVIDGAACKVVDIQTSKPGKHGHAKIRLTGVGIFDDKKRIIVGPGHDNVEVPVVEKKSAQILSMQGDTANVMDMESYETFDMKVPEELKGQAIEGSQVVYWIVLENKVMKQVKAE